MGEVCAIHMSLDSSTDAGWKTGMREWHVDPDSSFSSVVACDLSSVVVSSNHLAPSLLNMNASPVLAELGIDASNVSSEEVLNLLCNSAS